MTTDEVIETLDSINKRINYLSGRFMAQNMTPFDAVESMGDLGIRIDNLINELADES